MEDREKGIIARINGYCVFVDFRTDRITVWTTDALKPRAAETVRGIAKFVRNANRLAFGWGRFQDDGDEVIYICDKGDQNFGYAVNLDDSYCSEWGYAPF